MRPYAACRMPKLIVSNETIFTATVLGPKVFYFVLCVIPPTVYLDSILEYVKTWKNQLVHMHYALMGLVSKLLGK